MAGLFLDLIISLPTVLSCQILSIWLHIPNLAKLDSAYCNRNDRMKFQSLYGQPELVCSLDGCPRKYTNSILRKRIKLRYITIWAEINADVALAYLKDFGQYVQSATLSGDTCASVVNTVATHCSKLTSLTIHSATGGSFEFLTSFQSVESLSVCFMSNSAREQSKRDRTSELNCKKLRISAFVVNAQSDIAMLIGYCPVVTHFSLTCCDLLFNESISAMIIKWTHLVALNLCGPAIDDAALIAIVQNCSLLAHLDVHSCSDVTDTGMYTVATTLQLKSLSLPSDGAMTDKSLEYLHQCANTLKVLHIAQSVGFERTVKLTLSAVNTLLRKTDNCQYTWHVSIIDYPYDLRDCSNATAASVFTAITDALLTDIARHFKLLQTLDLLISSQHIASDYTHTGVGEVINNCPALEAIYIQPNKKDITFMEMMRSHNKLFARSYVVAFDVLNMS